MIGAGRIGRVHLEPLAGVPGVQPVILSDVVEPVLKEVTAQYGVPNYTLNGDEVRGGLWAFGLGWGTRVVHTLTPPSSFNMCVHGSAGDQPPRGASGVDLLPLPVPRGPDQEVRQGVF